ncbi:unnamed protein product [Prorocentrum cordatum]|nr:unnamed protein product [Polarella glacialis]
MPPIRRSASAPGVPADQGGPPEPALLRRSSIPPQRGDLRLDDFEVVGKPLGCGSFGSVNKVVRKDTGEVFAMKVMSKSQILEFSLGENIEREISTQQKARHPNILRLHEYFEDQEGVHLLLEYAPHGSLLDLLKDRRKSAAASDNAQQGLPEVQSAGMFRDVAEALHFLHCNCVVHRDLKPENILICEGGVAKLADFGWCNQLAKGAGRSTFCGTWEYLSPEMIANEPYDFKVDVWAAGVLLFEMLVGRSPFAASNYVQALSKISKVAYEFPGHVSAPARDLVGRLLVKEPRRRLGLGKAVEHPWVREHTSLERAEPAQESVDQRSPQAAGDGPPEPCRGARERAPQAQGDVHAVLLRAVRARSRTLLESALQKALAAGLQAHELAEARRALEEVRRRSEARRRLMSATHRRSRAELRMALAEVEKLDPSEDCELVEHARAVLASLSDDVESDHATLDTAPPSTTSGHRSLEATVDVASPPMTSGHRSLEATLDIASPRSPEPTTPAAAAAAPDIQAIYEATARTIQAVYEARASRAAPAADALAGLPQPPPAEHPSGVTTAAGPCRDRQEALRPPSPLGSGSFLWDSPSSPAPARPPAPGVVQLASGGSCVSGASELSESTCSGTWSGSSCDSPARTLSLGLASPVGCGIRERLARRKRQLSLSGTADGACMDDALGRDGLSATCPPKLLPQLPEQHGARAEPPAGCPSRPPGAAGLPTEPIVAAPRAAGAATAEQRGGTTTTASEEPRAPSPPRATLATGGAELPRHREKDVDLEDLQVAIPCTLLERFI